MSKQTVEFTRSNTPYNKGDVATFDIVVATKLRDRGVAMFLKMENEHDDDQSDDDNRETGRADSRPAKAVARAGKKDKPSKRVRVR